MEQNINLRGLLVDCISYYYESINSRTEVASPEAHLRIHNYKGLLIKLFPEEAVRLFCAREDKEGLRMLMKHDGIPEAIRNDCYSVLHPAKKCRAGGSGVYQRPSETVLVSRKEGRRVEALKYKKPIPDDHDGDRALRILEDGRN